MIQKTRGIALHVVKYGDTSVVASIYTEKFGRQAYLIKGAFSKNSLVRASYFQPLNLLEMEVYNRPGKNLQKIKEAQLSPVLNDIPFNPIKNTVSLFLAEILYRTLREEEANTNMFTFIYNAIQILDIEKNNVADFHLVFLMQLSKYLGFFPTNNFSERNNMFDLFNGRFVSQTPAHNKYLSDELAREFSLLIDKNFDLQSGISSMRKHRNALLEALSDYYFLHVEGMGKIKSLRVLRDVFEN